MPDTKILEVFPNPAPERDFLIEHTHHEFTSLCRVFLDEDDENIDLPQLAIRLLAERLLEEIKEETPRPGLLARAKQFRQVFDAWLLTERL